jgi:2-polyprenyl-3-methyl-5-hydroxy-6-metoxy-1,4-benzoquinol methylase/predicted SAM-dependent methyltransferase
MAVFAGTAESQLKSMDGEWAIPGHLGGHEGITHLDEGALDYLVSKFDIRTMLDIGCGPGGMVKLATSKGLLAVGVDGDPRLRTSSGLNAQQLIIHDFTQGPPEIGEEYDLAWSVEFLEHVSQQFQQNYMKLFRQAKLVFCTAAPPGKPGHHHVNCRDQEYWIRAFRNYGFHYDLETTGVLRTITTMKREFVRETAMFFVREEQNRLDRHSLESADGLRLDFGCGEAKPKPGYAGVDVRPLPGIRYICNAWEITEHVAPGSVSAIYSRHFLEHLTFAQADKTLEAWKTVLRPAGTLQIIVPDMTYHIRQFLEPDRQARSETNPEWTVRQHALAGFWGWQRGDTHDLWDVHKSGYDQVLLEESLRRHGFRNIARLEDHPWNLNITCERQDLRSYSGPPSSTSVSIIPPAIYPALRKRNVQVKTLEEVFDNIDEYIVQESFDQRPWQVYELTQSQDVSTWIQNPALIEGLSDNLDYLQTVIRSTRRPFRILDVGCYGGYLLDFLHQIAGLTPTDFCYKGIDIQAKAIEAASANHAYSRNADFQIEDVFQLREIEKENFYDIVWCSRVLIHLPYFERCLENLMHCTRQKALVVLKISDRSSCKKILELDHDTGKEVVYYFRSFSEQELFKAASARNLDFVIHSGEPYSTVIFRRKGNQASGGECTAVSARA